MSDKVFYDDDCYICSAVINCVREDGECRGIKFINISADDFNNFGIRYHEFMVGHFNNQLTLGPETMRALFKKAGYRKTVKVSKWWGVRQTLDFCYYLFAGYIRPWLPKKRRQNAN